MRLENYISDLLYRYQCVVVPGFGAFLTEPQPAALASDASVFSPPSKRISFNVQLMSNDGLLAKYIADAKQIPYEEALRYISKKTDAWMKTLRNRETVSLKSIGDLWVNESESIQFLPSEQVNYLSSSFGLGPVISSMVSRESLKQEVETLEEKALLHFTPEARKGKDYLRYVAVFLLLIATGTVGYRMVKDNRSQHYEMVQREAQQQVEKNIQQATFFDTNPQTLPPITLNLTKLELTETLPKYHVVGGAFRIESNADTKVRQLRVKGYKARRAGVNKYGLHIVSYGSFAGADEALELLQTIRTTETPEAWLWVSQ